MSNESYNLNFHETFPPNLAHISAILRLSSGDTPYTKEEISMQTGIPTGKDSGKVRPAIKYAYYMGLIDYTLNRQEYVLKRTRLGETVYFEDATLSEKLTQLLCHAMITSHTGATLWNVIFKKILSQNNGKIDMSLLGNSVKTILDTDKEINLSPFKSCYQNTFNALNLLSFQDNILQLNLMDTNTIDDDYIYLYAYVLLHEWEHLYTEQEITADMFDSINLWATFGWDKYKEYQVLEKLSDLRVIQFNRQLSPYTILRLTTSDSMIDKIYSLLL
jgi:hypothetical protein